MRFATFRRFGRLRGFYLEFLRLLRFLRLARFVGFWGFMRAATAALVPPGTYILPDDVIHLLFGEPGQDLL